MAIVCDPEDVDGVKIYFLDGPLEGESRRVELLDAGFIPPERIATYKPPPLGWEECDPGEPISPPAIAVSDYYRIHDDGKTYFYSLTQGINHHKIHMIEKYQGCETHEEGSQVGEGIPHIYDEAVRRGIVPPYRRTATDINAERERRLIEIEQAARADIDDSIIQEMIQSALPPYAAHQWGERPGRQAYDDFQDSMNHALRAFTDNICRAQEHTQPPQPPPIQPPDCYFCPKKKLDVFFASKRLPGQDGKKRIACQACMEERKEKRIAREVRK